MSRRFRTEGEEAVLELRIASVERLFDNRDPAPFHERALDPGFVEYLVEGGREHAGAERLRIVVHLAQPCAPGEVERAIRAHFEEAFAAHQRTRQRQLRTGRIALGIAAVAVVVLVGLGELVATHVAGRLGSGLREALVISGWVLMWRPIEVLVYDGIPWRAERRVLAALRDARVEVRVGLP